MLSLHQNDLKFGQVEPDFLEQPSEVWWKRIRPNGSTNVSNRRKRSSATDIGRRMQLDERGEGYWDFVRISDSIFMTLSDVSYQEREDVIVQGEDLVKIRFVLEGNMDWSIQEMNPTGGSEPVVGRYAMISYHPRGVDSLYSLEPNVRHNMVTLHCKRAFIAETFSGQFSKFFPTDSLAELRRPVSVAQPLQPRMNLCVNELLSSPYLGQTRQTFMYAKALELLCNVAHGFSAVSGEASGPSSNILLTKTDREKLAKIRAILDDEHAEWHTSQELAKEFGLNTKKLKYGFKKLYGVTPYKYAVESRMQRAFSLLKEEGVSVSEVAYVLGYDHPANFATAFKRRYGFSPQTLRRQLP